MNNFEYHIDEKDQISYVNAAWIDFSKENQAKHLSLPEILGRSLWTNINNRARSSVRRPVRAP